MVQVCLIRVGALQESGLPGTEFVTPDLYYIEHTFVMVAKFVPNEM